jgi:hypothetical protein
MKGKRKLLPEALGAKGATARKLCDISIYTNTTKYFYKN